MGWPDGEGRGERMTGKLVRKTSGKKCVEGSLQTGKGCEDGVYRVNAQRLLQLRSSAVKETTQQFSQLQLSQCARTANSGKQALSPRYGAIALFPGVTVP